MKGRLRIPKLEALGESLFSRYLPPGRRTDRSYAVDVRRVPRGKLVAVLTEAQVVGGEHHRHAILIDEAHLTLVLGLLAEAGEAMKRDAESVKERASSKSKPMVTARLREAMKQAESITAKRNHKVEADKQATSRAGVKWSDAEEMHVLDELSRGTTVEEIGAQLLRKLSGVRARVEKLGILEAEDLQLAARDLLARRGSHSESKS